MPHKAKPPRLPKPVVEALDATGRSWELRRGSKHWKLFIGGRMASVVSNNCDWNQRHRIDNTIREIRRAAC